MKRVREGFTLIELLVVVAIIGLLSSVVLGALSLARDKAGEVAVEQSLKGVKITAEQVYIDAGSYSTICDIGSLTQENLIRIAETYSSGQVFGDDYGCNTGPLGYAAWVKTKNDEFFCVDNSGNLEKIAEELGVGQLTCS